MRAKEFVAEQVVTEKNVPTNPSKWSYYKNQAKKKFDVYPSAYANAWAAKKYKAAGGKWKTESIQHEAEQSPYAIGMAKAMKMYKDKPPLAKKTIKKAHEIAKAVMKDDVNEEDLSNCKYGKYYCSTDKKYKCRQGPKQSRS